MDDTKVIYKLKELIKNNRGVDYYYVGVDEKAVLGHGIRFCEYNSNKV